MPKCTVVPLFFSGTVVGLGESGDARHQVGSQTMRHRDINARRVEQPSLGRTEQFGRIVRLADDHASLDLGVLVNHANQTDRHDRNFSGERHVNSAWLAAVNDAIVRKTRSFWEQHHQEATSKRSDRRIE